MEIKWKLGFEGSKAHMNFRCCFWYPRLEAHAWIAFSISMIRWLPGWELQGLLFAFVARLLAGLWLFKHKALRFRAQSLPAGSSSNRNRRATSAMESITELRLSFTFLAFALPKPGQDVVGITGAEATEPNWPAWPLAFASSNFAAQLLRPFFLQDHLPMPCQTSQAKLCL